MFSYFVFLSFLVLIFSFFVSRLKTPFLFLTVLPASSLLSAYSTFYIIGLVLSMQIPFVGFQPIRTSEHMAAAGRLCLYFYYKDFYSSTEAYFNTEVYFKRWGPLQSGSPIVKILCLLPSKSNWFSSCNSRPTFVLYFIPLWVRWRLPSGTQSPDRGDSSTDCLVFVLQAKQSSY